MFPLPDEFPPSVAREEVPIVISPLYSISPPLAYRATFPSPPFILILLRSVPDSTVNFPLLTYTPKLSFENFSIVISGVCILVFVLAWVYITPTALSTKSVDFPVIFPLLSKCLVVPSSISVQSKPVVSFLLKPILALTIAFADGILEIFPAIYTPLAPSAYIFTGLFK